MTQTTSPTHAKTFPQAIGQEVLVFDGAMGTEIYRHHVFTNRCFDELSVSDPKLIRQIHQDYRDAGADVLTTNTFGANRVTLAKFGLGEQTRAINLAGARLAREVAAGAASDVYVAGSIGPMPPQPQYEPLVEEMILEQVDSLIEGGADFILFETQVSRKGIEQCARAMRSRRGVPFVLSFAVEQDAGVPCVEFVDRMLAPLPDDAPQPVAWSMNCGSGPDGLLSAVERAVKRTTLPLVVMPNAGIPREVENRRIYYCSPEYLAEYGKRYVALGASAVGGCCGTTPDHIRALADMVKPLTRKRISALATPAPEVQPKPEIPMAEKSRLAWRLANRQWVATVELLPPRGYDLTDTIQKSRHLYRHGVDAINLPDGPRASSRISSLLAAERIQRDAQIETVLHFCCRDRNLIGMQADLLACAAAEIHNILFITGDPPKLGNYPHATGVFDTDSIGMVAVQKRLNQGIDLGGQELARPTQTLIGVGLDPTALDSDREIDRFRQKVENGAEFAITQPVFNPDALLRFLDRVAEYSIPILAGIWPLASLRNASFMQNEVPGVDIPQSIMDRMASVESREDQLKMGIAIARESVERIRDRVAGIQVSAPLGKVHAALDVIQGT